MDFLKIKKCIYVYIYRKKEIRKAGMKAGRKELPSPD
jgi:hypothetical protein